jgi:uncharacterized protein
MEIDLEKIEVVHNETENRFEVWIGEYLSKLDYMLNGDSIVMTHVGVPPELRGHAIAGKITQVALEYAKGKSLRVIPMCSYVAAYIKRNPQYAGLTRQKADA